MALQEGVGIGGSRHDVTKGNQGLGGGGMHNNPRPDPSYVASERSGYENPNPGGGGGSTTPGSSGGLTNREITQRHSRPTSDDRTNVSIHKTAQMEIPQPPIVPEVSQIVAGAQPYQVPSTFMDNVLGAVAATTDFFAPGGNVVDQQFFQWSAAVQRELNLRQPGLSDENTTSANSTGLAGGHPASTGPSPLESLLFQEAFRPFGRGR